MNASDGCRLLPYAQMLRNHLEHLIDGELVVQTVVEVPAEVKTTIKNTGKKKEKIVRPAHKFAFLCLTENVESSEEWNKKSVEKWIAEFKQASVK